LSDDDVREVDEQAEGSSLALFEQVMMMMISRRQEPLEERRRKKKEWVEIWSLFG